MKPTVNIKRAYEKPSKKDGFRVLIDRLWPRGVKKEDAAIDYWARDLAPSAELRTWFGHDPERWTEFQKKYKAELKKNQDVGDFIETYKDKKIISLIYAAKDEQHTHALVLQRHLEALFN